MQQLTVLFDGLPHVGHNFRAHRASRGGDVLDVVLNGLLEGVGGGLAVILGEFGQSVVQSGAHIQAHFSSWYGALLRLLTV
jgi:hypothetical protein